LELSLLDVCRELQVAAWREAREPGVWCRCGRLAALGLTVRSGVTHHGLFVNVSPSMDLQRMVSLPTGGRVSSLSTQRLRPTSMHSVRESLIRNMATRFGYDNFHVYTGHPALRRTREVVAIA
jgi:lipoyl(octanoyl) transferase